MRTLTYQLEYKRDGSGFFEVGVTGDDIVGRKLVHRDNTGIWRLANSADAAKMPSLGIRFLPQGMWVMLRGVGLRGFPYSLLMCRES